MLCREGQPKKTSKFFGRVCVFRAPDLVSPHNSASAAYQSVSQLKMAFVLQSQQTGAGWPAAVIPGRQKEALFVMTSILRDDYGKNPRMSFASVLIRVSIIGRGHLCKHLIVPHVGFFKKKMLFFFFFIEHRMVFA